MSEKRWRLATETTIETFDGLPVAKCTGKGTARFILKACEEHAALETNLKEAVRLVRELLQPTMTRRQILDDALDLFKHVDGPKPVSAARTPGLLRIEGPSGNDGEAEVIVSDTRTICWTANTWDDELDGEVVTSEDQANGRFIVKSWNEHDALVADNARLREALAETIRLRAALEVVENCAAHDPDCSYRFHASECDCFRSTVSAALSRKAGA